MLFHKKVIFIFISTFACGLASPWRNFDMDEFFKEPSYLGQGITEPPPIHGIVGWLEGTDKLTGEKKKINFEGESDKKEIVAKEMKDISVHCEAIFPVELDFQGNTVRTQDSIYDEHKLQNTGTGSSMSSFSNGTVTMDVERHTMYAFLPADCSHCTGRYICKGSEEKEKNEKTAVAYIHFATDKLFILSRTATISSDQIPFIIPCGLSEPNATVALVKLESEQNIVRHVPFEKYDKQTGFHLIKGQDNSEGAFYCIAKHGNIQRAVQYHVIKGNVTCDKKCNENAECSTVNSRNVCKCMSGYQETLVSEKCLKPCREDGHCDGNMSCIPQDAESYFLDILAYPEGRAGDEERDHQKRGECKNPCIFTDVKCANEEVCMVLDHKPVCRSGNER